MGWSGSLSAASAVGSSITFTPDTGSEGGYTVSAFTAPKKGVYRFQLSGSGGTTGSTEADNSGAFTNGNLPGGTGGYTDGYLLLEKGQTVYVGAGGPCSAAFVAGAYGASLAAIGSASVYLVAGAGGAGGRCTARADDKRYGTGGNGGGTTGGSGSPGGSGGTQSAGGAPGSQYNENGPGYSGSYGTGGAYGYAESVYGKAWGGRGGDGYYGGGSGVGYSGHNSSTDFTISIGYGGGGGSGYVKQTSLTVLGKTYVSSTRQGGGAGANSRGSVVVTYTARALLPVIFDGVQLERLFFNGTEAESLVFNGTTIYMRRGSKWLSELKTRLLRRARLSARPMRSLTAST